MVGKEEVRGEKKESNGGAKRQKSSASGGEWSILVPLSSKGVCCTHLGIVVHKVTRPRLGVVESLYNCIEDAWERLGIFHRANLTLEERQLLARHPWHPL